VRCQSVHQRDRRTQNSHSVKASAVTSAQRKLRTLGNHYRPPRSKRCPFSRGAAVVCTENSIRHALANVSDQIDLGGDNGKLD
jgi:hypothetical protein